MKVEVWSDFICPFCYIGKRRLEEALAQLPFQDQVEVVFKSYQLDSRTPKDVPYGINEMLSKKYGMSLEQAKQANASVAAQAEQVGLIYSDDRVVTNTFDAHRLAHFAASHGKAKEMTERLLYAYFTEAKHIGDREVLADLAADIGLNRGEALDALNADAYADEVRADEQEGADLGIRGVPFFVVDRKYGISGAQPASVFVDTLTKAWNESRPTLTVIGDADSSDAACVDGSCAVPADKQS